MTSKKQIKKADCIYGIQQIGLGVSNLQEMHEWYSRNLGFDIKIFEDDNIAELMAPYMGNKPRKKKAKLIMNLAGGAGLELWQHTERPPEKRKNTLVLGDFGINYITLKSSDIEKAYKSLKKKNIEILSELVLREDLRRSFFIQDPEGNYIEIKEGLDFFNAKKGVIGGIQGCTIGVKDLDKALILYRDLLGYKTVIYDFTSLPENIPEILKSKNRLRRVLLHRSNKNAGKFSNLLGSNQIELIQNLDYSCTKVYQDRYWGDPGFMHICHDIKSMESFKKTCRESNYIPVVESPLTFDMGATQGQWFYIEDDDGTLVEFVETHKLSILPQLGLNINLKNRNQEDNLPNWLIQMLSMKKSKS